MQEIRQSSAYLELQATKHTRHRKVQTFSFFKALANKYQDDAFHDLEREKRFSKEVDQRHDFVFRMGYNRATRTISRNNTIDRYNGSTYNRKEIKKIDPLEIKEKNDVKSKMLNKMSKATKEKVKSKLHALFAATQGKKGYRSGKINFTFLTLTFVNDVTDNNGMDIFNKFFTQLRERYGLINYVSVSERQNNGRIHFHILLDLQLPILYINSLWAKQQFESGIIHEQNEIFLIEKYGKGVSALHTAGMYKQVQEKYNGLDVKSVTTADGISCYLTKYVTKNDGFFECRTWTCSQSVSKLFTGKLINYNVFGHTCDNAKNRIKSKEGWYKDSKTGKTVFKPAKEYISTMYNGQWCQIVTIYNKKHYNKYMFDVDEMNAEILKLSLEKKIIPDYMVKDLLSMSKFEFRAANLGIEY